MDFGSLPFVPLYRTDDEFAAEISNQTVHGVMHLAWVDQGEGRYQGQMAVYVKPRGALRAGLHGADQTVPVLDRLPGADAADGRMWNRGGDRLGSVGCRRVRRRDRQPWHSSIRHLGRHLETIHRETAAANRIAPSAFPLKVSEK